MLEFMVRLGFGFHLFSIEEIGFLTLRSFGAEIV
jgi:hypothetical protein